jgi:hypothetical protein
MDARISTIKSAAAIPSIAPATGTPESGGWTTRELKRFIKGLEGVNLVAYNSSFEVAVFALGPVFNFAMDASISTIKSAAAIGGSQPAI